MYVYMYMYAEQVVSNSLSTQGQPLPQLYCRTTLVRKPLRLTHTYIPIIQSKSFTCIYIHTYIHTCIHTYSTCAVEMYNEFRR